MYTIHQTCRACGFPTPTADGAKIAGHESLVPVFDLGIQPLANDFCNDQEEHAGYAPLKVLHCPKCTLAQLSVVVRPEILYSKYLYVTSKSKMMEDHFANLHQAIRDQAGQFKTLLEIGSNDGSLLAYFAAQGVTVAGIDPANNLTAESRKHLLPTVTGMFNEENARASLAVARGGFDVVLARHVFCHIDNWRQFITDLEIVCHAQSLVCIEVPYLQDLLDRFEFDTIYHEHLSYLSIRAMKALLKNSMFELCHIGMFPIHGGAIVLMLSPRTANRVPTGSIDTFLEHESIDPLKWADFNIGVQKTLEKLTAFVALRGSRRIAVLGASAKATVWINACNFRKKDIAFAADTTMGKWYRCIPGTDIPVTDENAIMRELPDFVICGAWNFREEILSKNALAREKGVKFVFTVPEFEVV